MSFPFAASASNMYLWGDLIPAGDNMLSLGEVGKRFKSVLAYLLDVYNLNVTGNITASGNISAGGNLSATGTTTSGGLLTATSGLSADLVEGLTNGGTLTIQSNPTGTGHITLNGLLSVLNTLTMASGIGISVDSIQSTTANASLNLAGNGTGVVLVPGTADSSTTTTGALQVAGGVGIGKAVTIGSFVNVNSIVDSTGTVSGALVVSGGVGIGKALNVGTTATVNSSTASTSSTTGAVVVSGGIGVGGNSYFGGDVHIPVGNLYFGTGAGSLPFNTYIGQTWTPTLGDGTNNVGTTTATGYYYRLTGFVAFTAWIVWNSKGSASGNIRLSLPIAIGASWPRAIATVGYASGVTYTGQFMLSGNQPNTYLGMFYQTEAGANTTMTCTTNLAAAGELQVSGFYGLN